MIVKVFADRYGNGYNVVVYDSGQDIHMNYSHCVFLNYGKDQKLPIRDDVNVMILGVREVRVYEDSTIELVVSNE